LTIQNLTDAKKAIEHHDTRHYLMIHKDTAIEFVEQAEKEILRQIDEEKERNIKQREFFRQFGDMKAIVRSLGFDEGLEKARKIFTGETKDNKLPVVDQQ